MFRNFIQKNLIMKNLLFTLAFLVSCFCSFAQDVTIKKDIIYKDGEPYAKMRKSGAIVHDFLVSTLDGEEILAAIHQGDGAVYIITFMGSGAKGQMEGNLAFAKRLAKELVISNIIKDGKLNPAGERRFLLLHPVAGAVEPIVDIPPGNTPANSGILPPNDELPERNTSAPVMIFGKEISQDNTIIGTYKSRQSVANGMVYHIVSIYSTTGNKVAEATLENVGAKSARIKTFNDNRLTPIPIKALDDMGIAKEIAAWLVARYYL